ncbi:MAG: hypothetical protein MJ132_09125 [Clostridia bacterium]|nr:hypothetical protein [Clostridia bacterium]
MDGNCLHTNCELIPEVPATCTETGLKAHYQCSSCEKVFDEDQNETTLPDLVIGVIDHTFEPYYLNVAWHCQECTVCGEQTEREAHTYVDADDGKKECTKCGYIKTPGEEAMAFAAAVRNMEFAANMGKRFYPSSRSET